MKAISLVPDFGRVALADLPTFDMAAFRVSMRAALRDAGIDHYLLGLDISLNHEAGRRDEAYFQVQLWGYFEEPAGPWRKRLKALVNASKRVHRPIKVVRPDSVKAAAAYGLKSIFKRRISHLKANLNRQDRGACRNTHDCPLRGAAWVELMLFLERIGLENRLLRQGVIVPFQPLKSR